MVATRRSASGDSPGLLCLVTGATGYIGGRLVPELLAAGHRVRVPGPAARRSCATTRGPATSRWSRATRSDAGSLARGDGRRRRRLLPGPRARHRRGFEETDRETARTFGDGRASRRRRAHRLPRRAHARRPDRASSPPHLRSRPRWARSCSTPACPTAVLRAAVIIGSGSASFEMLRYLTERLPVMVTPSWVRQPDPADRGPRRAALPGRLRRPCPREVNRGVRHRRARRPDLPPT